MASEKNIIEINFKIKTGKKVSEHEQKIYNYAQLFADDINGMTKIMFMRYFEQYLIENGFIDGEFETEDTHSESIIEESIPYQEDNSFEIPSGEKD